jgi:hypothetical protein
VRPLGAAGRAMRIRESSVGAITHYNDADARTLHPSGPLDDGRMRSCSR